LKKVRRSKEKETQDIFAQEFRRSAQISPFLNNIPSNMSDSVMVIDEDYICRFINESAKNFYGNMLGKKCHKMLRDLDSPCYHTGVLCEVHEILEKGANSFEDTRLAESTGRVTHIRAKPIKTSDGKRGIILVSRDVAEEGRAQERLRETQEFSSSLLANSPNPILVANKDTTIRYVNPALESLTCYSSSEILGRKAPYPWWPKETKDEISKRHKKQMRHGATRYEEHFQTKNGKDFWIEVSATPITSKGTLRYCLSIWVDITERKRIEKELSSSISVLRATLDSTADGVLTVDNKEKITNYNQRFIELTGIPEHILESGDDRNVVAFLQEQAKDPQIVYRRIRRSFAHPGVESFDLLEFKDGRMFERYSRPSWIEGRIVGRVVSFRDITERKRAEEAVREGEQFSLSLLNNSTYPMVVINSDTSIRFVNPALEKLTGYSSSELIGEKPPYRWWPKEHVGTLGKLFEELNLKGTVHYEQRFQRKNREPFWVEVHNTLVRDHGKINYYLGNWVDITERKRMEQKLEGSLSVLRATLESTADGILVVDSEKRVTDYNQRYVDMIRIPETILTTRDDREFITFIQGQLKDPERFVRSTAELFAKPDMELLDTVEFKDGRVFERYSRPQRIGGRTVGRVVSLRDITERKRLEEELTKHTDHLEDLVREKSRDLAVSEERYRRLLEHAPDIIFVQSEGKIIYINPTGARLLGAKNPKEIIGRSVIDIVHPDYRASARERMRRAIEEERSAPIFEEKFLRLDGAAIDVEVVEIPINYLGRPAVQGVAHDVTERKCMQAQFLKSERMAAIGELAGMVGHDLRNPLQGILAAAYALKVGLRTSTDEKVRTMLEIVEKDVAYANKIVGDLLDYSGEVRLELTVIDQGSLIEDALASLRVPENIQISNLTGDEPKVRVDAAKLRRVYVNLIKNAIDAMPAGGKLKITSETSEGNLRVAFADTGDGMTQEVMEKLWVPLFTTKAKGMGFGLPICKRIVEAHGGSILVESTVGKGSTFTVSIPIK
jgi:PAS domain S-box-containing protein